MSQFGSTPLVVGQDLFVTGTTVTAGFPTNTLGAYAETNDGRGFRYTQAGATALVPGKLQQSAAQDTANWQNLSPVAAAAGATSVTIATATTFTANQIVGGQLVVTVAPGAGYSYRVSANSAVTGGSVVIKLEDPLIVALTPTSKIDVQPSIYNGAVVNPTTATGIPVGVAISAIPAYGFGWVQTHGIANVLADGALVVGQNVSSSTGATGALVATTSALVTNSSIGYAVTGVATGEYGQVFLTID